MASVRFYTEGRRQPVLVGKDASGKRIPGGPYIVWQGAGLLLAPILWATQDLWGRGWGPLPRVLTIACLCALAFWLIGRVPFGRRNPLWLAKAVGGALWSAPKVLQVGGRALSVEAPKKVQPLLIEHTRATTSDAAFASMQRLLTPTDDGTVEADPGRPPQTP